MRLYFEKPHATASGEGRAFNLWEENMPIASLARRSRWLLPFLVTTFCLPLTSQGQNISVDQIKWPSAASVSTNGQVQFKSPSSIASVVYVTPGGQYTTIAAAIAACGAAIECEIDARGSGNQSISSTIHVGSASHVMTLRLGNYAYSGTADPLFLLHPRSTIVTEAGTLIHETGASANAIICGGRGGAVGLSGGIDGNGEIEVDGAGAALVMGGTSDPGNSASNYCSYAHFGPLTYLAPSGIGHKYGDHAFIINHFGAQVEAAQDLDFPRGLSDSGEQVNYHGGAFSIPNGRTSISPTCIYEASTGVRMFGTSIDDCGVTLEAMASLELHSVHFENPGITSAAPYVVFGPTAGGNGFRFAMYGGEFQEDSASTRTMFIQDASNLVSAYKSIILNGVGFLPQEPVRYGIDNTGGQCCEFVSYENVYGGKWTPSQPVSGPYKTMNIDSPRVPSISFGFNSGMIRGNGVKSIVITVGSGRVGSEGVLTMPYIAPNGWTCQFTNQSRADVIQQTANTATSSKLTNYGTTFAATNWTNNDVLTGSCTPN